MDRRHEGRQWLLWTLLLALTLIPGCGNPVSEFGPSALPASRVLLDYPGWTSKNISTVTTSRVAGRGAPFYRQDASMPLLSPDGRIRMLAWYSRSATSAVDLANKPWTTLDRFYGAKSKESTAAMIALFRDYTRVFPADGFRGAFEVTRAANGARRLYIGYYRESAGRRSWEAGERVFVWDSNLGHWSLESTDSGSGDSWQALSRIRP